MKDPVNLLEVWLGPDVQVEKNWAEVSIKVAIIIKIWSWQWLSLKGIVEIANVFIASVIIFRLKSRSVRIRG